jgi:hypothetical protein
MDTATKILIAGGMVNLVYAFVTGLFFALERGKKEFAHRYLVMAHTGPLMQGVMLLGLCFAVSLSALGARVETLAAAALVAGSFCIAAKDTINWVTGVRDEFKAKPPLQVALGTAGVALSFAGLLVLFYGVFKALLGAA